MSKHHLKSIAAPKSWPIKRKEHIFVARPNPGPHKLENSMPISLILKMLLQVKTAREAKQVINQRKILVNKKPIDDIRFPAGLFDVVEFSDKYFRILLNNRGKLIFKEISKAESSILLCKIIKKTRLKGNKTQLNFHNGFNILVEKNENDYKANDVLILGNENNEIKDRISFEKGNLVYIIKGKNLGKTARIEEVHEKPPFNNQITVSIDDKKMNLPKDYVFLMGKTKPIITLSEKSLSEK